MVYFILFLQSLLSGGTYIIAKLVARDVEPITLTFVRSTLAAAGLYIMVRIRGTRLVFERKDWGMIIFLSILAIPVNQFLFLIAIHHTTASNASLIYAGTPAVVLVLSALSGTERLTFLKTLGVAIAFLGILIVIFEHGIDLRSDNTFGNILVMLAMLAWSLYTVYGRPLIMKYGAFATGAATMILGGIFFIPIGLMNTLNFPFHTLTAMHWAGFLYLAMITSIFSYLLWYYALARTEASKVAIFTNLQPILTSVLAVIILGQAITGQFVLGGLIALAGVILTQFG